MSKPQIRFKGFEDKWESHSLSDLGEVKMCKRILKSQTSDKGDVPFFKIGTFGKEPDAYISRELFDEYKRLYSYPKIGDVIVSAAGTIGRISVFDGKPAYFQDSNLIWIDNDNSIIDNSFLAVAYPRIKWAVSSTTIARIYNDTVRQTTTKAPVSIKEQCEIGNYFNQIDEIIAEAEREVSRLEKMKQASLQKMFPRPGAAAPEIRFDGFSDLWVEKKIADCASFSRGQRYTKNDLRESGTQIFLYGRLYTKYSTYIDSVDTYSFLAPFSVLSKGNEVVMPSSGETAEDIAIASAILSQGIILSGGLNIIIPKNDIDHIFLALSLTYSQAHYELAKKAQGKSVVHIYNQDIADLTISYPSAIAEQKAIGEYFRNLDSLLSTKRQKLVKLRNIKQACLDKMFVNTSKL